jgi:hypothetical protein
MGAPFSVISGGVGCLLATGWVAATTPDLRQYRADIDKTTAMDAKVAKATKTA